MKIRSFISTIVLLLFLAPVLVQRRAAGAGYEYTNERFSSSVKQMPS